MPNNHFYNGTASFLGGHLYAVTHDQEAPMQSLVWTILLAACAEAPAEFVVDRECGENPVYPPLLARQGQQALDAGRIRIFQRSSGNSSNLAGVILEELDYFGVNKGGLVVIEGADRFFDHAAGLDPVPAIAECQQWAEQHGCALLLLCPCRAGRPDPAVAIMRMANRFTGFARLRQIDENLWWDVFHWFGTQNLVADRSFRLSVQDSGALGVEEDACSRQLLSALAVDEDAVFVVHSALLPGESCPTAWRMLGNFETLTAAVTGATAATIILPFDSNIPLETLTHLIFRLRHSCGARVKIVIREINTPLRYSQEQLLLRIGANLVTPLAVGFSRFISMIGMVQGQIYSRDLEGDYETTVAGVLPDMGHGYLPPDIFVKTVSEILARVREVRIENALIYLPLVSGLTPLDALRSCVMKRQGDLCTADNNGGVYIFLFACRESDVRISLDRIFRLPVTVLFDSEVFYCDGNSISQGLSSLTARLTKGEFPDFAAKLAACAEEYSLDIHAETFSSRPPSPSPRPLFFPAVRRPLALLMPSSEGCGG